MTNHDSYRMKILIKRRMVVIELYLTNKTKFEVNNKKTELAQFKNI
uniref:Uncharacterized protein n=1 Tax=Zea mays TaxID=4577 RepID=B4FA20_MAIZE|nr:unknown [Zea mays]